MLLVALPLLAAGCGSGTAAIVAGSGDSGAARLMARLGASVIGGGELTLGLGNDAPVILSVDQIAIYPDEGEASPTTGIELTAADSSDDTCR